VLIISRINCINTTSGICLIDKYALFCILFANWQSPATLTEVFPYVVLCIVCVDCNVLCIVCVDCNVLCIVCVDCVVLCTVCVDCVVLCIVCVDCVVLCIVCVDCVVLCIVCVDCVVLCIVCVDVLFYALFVSIVVLCIICVDCVLCNVCIDCVVLCIVLCKCVLYYCHRVDTQLQLNIYHITSLYVDDRLVCRFGSNQTCRLDGHLNRVTYTRCRINTIDSPDDEHRGARNM
jgi:hypothetical protein